MKYLALKSILLLFFCLSRLTASSGWVWINYLGGSESTTSSLYINREGTENDIKTHQADWEGKPFTNSAYYAMKLEKWTQNKGYGLEWVHHKIYLKNNIEGIDSFSISDGFNLLFLNKIMPLSRLGNRTYLRIGAGLVFAHMDVELTGEDEFYMDGGIAGSYFAGGAIQVALDKWVKTFKSHFVTIETKFTAAYCRGPVSKTFTEYAVLPNYAFHILVGVGNKPASPKTIKEAVKTFGIPSLYMGSTGYLIKRIDKS